MDITIRNFWARHPELKLLHVVKAPSGPVYNFMAGDGVRVNVSIDYGAYKHMSFSKRQPPLFTMGQASEREINRYLDFLGDAKPVVKPSPLGTGIIHVYEVGHPDFTAAKTD